MTLFFGIASLGCLAAFAWILYKGDDIRRGARWWN
jgi:hypothetical protein